MTLQDYRHVQACTIPTCPQLEYIYATFSCRAFPSCITIGSVIPSRRLFQLMSRETMRQCEMVNNLLEAVVWRGLAIRWWIVWTWIDRHRGRWPYSHWGLDRHTVLAGMIYLFSIEFLLAFDHPTMCMGEADNSPLLESFMSSVS